MGSEKRVDVLVVMRHSVSALHGAIGYRKGLDQAIDAAITTDAEAKP